MKGAWFQYLQAFARAGKLTLLEHALGCSPANERARGINSRCASGCSALLCKREEREV